MSIEKSEFKKAVLSDVGADVEDMLESLQAQTAEHRGAKKALRETGLKFAAIAKAIDDELENGKLGEFVGEPLKVAEYAKRQVQRCVEALLSASAHEGNLELSSLGAITAAKAVMTRVTKKIELETAKAEALAKAEEAVAAQRVAGEHPGSGLAQQRKIEAQAPLTGGAERKLAKKAAKPRSGTRSK
jgi:hypothetical protein